MRVLVTIPHYFPESPRTTPGEIPPHGSLGGDPAPRVRALTDAITALHQLFSADQRIIEVASRVAFPANQGLALDLEIVVCTTGFDHLLPHLELPPQSYQHHAARCEPHLLGFECHEVLRQRLGQFDYYAYLEDDLVCRDPWLFAKLSWFNRVNGDWLVLQPNRYEVCGVGFVPKAYIDGDLLPEVTSNWLDPSEPAELRCTYADWSLGFQRAKNPHSGCFFLNARQMHHWASQSYFGDRDVSFVGPLESAATLGILKTFQVFKPGPWNASFLEIEHWGTAFISGLRLVVPPDQWA